MRVGASAASCLRAVGPSLFCSPSGAIGVRGSSRRSGALAWSRPASPSGLWSSATVGLLVPHGPAWSRRALQPRLRDHPPELPREAAQTYFARPQRSGGIARRLHAQLHARDKLGVLGVDAPVDPPVEVTRRLHLTSVVRKSVA